MLCEIDVKAKLEGKLGVEREPCLILGACNPALASEDLNTEPILGVLLPCNVVVYEREGHTSATRSLDRPPSGFEGIWVAWSKRSPGVEIPA